MNFFYKKMYNKNYLVLNDFDITTGYNDYSYEMLRRNNIKGLLSLEYSMEDNKPFYYYDITAKYSFNSCFYELKLNKEHILSFFTALHNITAELNRFLLDASHLVLLPQCVFCNKDLDHFSFVYCPDYNQDFFSSLKEFISYLLTIANHDDEKTVLLSYGLWQEVQNENFNLKSLMKVIEKHNTCDTPVKTQNTIFTPISETPVPTDTTILKEPDVLLKENYYYDTGFLIKTAAVFAAIFVALAVNVLFKLLSFYSMEMFFIILTSLLVFLIFYTSKVLRIAPLYKQYSKPLNSHEEKIIKIDTDISLSPVSDTDENTDTVLLCVNPTSYGRHLVYTGIDFSQEAELNTFPFCIGKSEGNNLMINNPAVSRKHARLTFSNGSYYLEDLNSSNGTRVNDELIPAYTLTEITTADRITFAHLTYIFQ